MEANRAVGIKATQVIVALGDGMSGVTDVSRLVDSDSHDEGLESATSGLIGAATLGSSSRTLEMYSADATDA